MVVGSKPSAETRPTMYLTNFAAYFRRRKKQKASSVQLQLTGKAKDRKKARERGGRLLYAETEITPWLDPAGSARPFNNLLVHLQPKTFSSPAQPSPAAPGPRQPRQRQAASNESRKSKHLGNLTRLLIMLLAGWIAHSPGGSVGTRIRRRALADGPPVVFVQSVVLEAKGGHAAAPGPEEQQLPPVALLEFHRPLPEPSDHLVARAEAPVHLIHVPAGSERREDGGCCLAQSTQQNELIKQTMRNTTQGKQREAIGCATPTRRES